MTMLFHGKAAKSIKVRIKAGASVMQDHAFRRWPDLPGGDHDPDTVFDGEWRPRTGSSGYWYCTAPGYGELGTGRYGNGSIFVSDHDGVVTPDGKPVRMGELLTEDPDHGDAP